MSQPAMSRHWVMPDKWTFKMPEAMDIIRRHITCNWVDPFAGLYSPAEITNDIEAGRGASYCMDGLEFLSMFEENTVNGALFDPPYSHEQCLRKYTPKQNGTAGRAEYWARCKDQIAHIVRPGGGVISFCWDSNGMGVSRGFDIIEVALLCHGPCHNDTIVTVEKKHGETRGLFK